MLPGPVRRGSRRPAVRGFAVIAAGSVLCVLAMCGALPGASQVDNPQYLSPGEVAVSSDGSRLYVTCEESNELRMVDTLTGSVMKSLSVGRVPRGLAVSPDGSRIFVANSWDDNITVVDSASFAVLRILPAGWEPTSVITDLTGKNLYVANRLSDDLSVIELATAHESKRIPAGRGASYLARAGNTPFIYSSHVYPNIKGPRRNPESQITVIEGPRQAVVGTEIMSNAAGVFHVAFSADGRLGVAAHLRPKNLIPLAHVEHGWAFGNSLLLFGARCGRSHLRAARRNRSLLRNAVRSRYHSRQVEDLRQHFGIRLGDRHFRTQGADVCEGLDVVFRQRPLRFLELRRSTNRGWPKPSRYRAITGWKAALRRQPSR